MKALQLKEKKPWAFWLMILPILALGILALVQKLIVSGAIKDVKKTEKKDQELKEKQKEYETRAKVKEENADKIEKEIKEVRDSNPDLDWHEKE